MYHPKVAGLGPGGEGKEAEGMPGRNENVNNTVYDSQGAGTSAWDISLGAG